MVGQRRGEPLGSGHWGRHRPRLVAEKLTWRRRARAWVVRAALVPGILGAAACGVDEFQLTTGPHTGFVTDHRPSLLVGEWASILYLQTPSGIQASETIWEFRADGEAIRTTILRHVASGVMDQTIATGQWGVQSGLVVVNFDPPHSGTVRLRFSVHGDLLLLDSREFQRIR